MAHVRKLERGDGKVAYEVRWRDGGKFRQRTFKVARQAERFALKIENELAEGTTTDPYVKRSTTVAEAVEACLAVDAHKLKPRTLAGYRLIYDATVLPHFGSKKIAAVTSQDVEKWVQGLVAQGMAPGTVRNHFRALGKVFRYAVRHRLIPSNPAAGTPLPRATGEQVFAPQFLTPAEVERLARELDAFHPYGLLVRFAAYTGLRAAELAALRVRDINLLRKEVRVERTVHRVKGEMVVGSPKSARSTRTVPILHGPLVADLRAYLATHPHRADPDAALWPGHAPRTPVPDWDDAFDHGRFYGLFFKPALRRAGLAGTRFHDLRHTYASLMFAAGIEPYKVSRWMGHGSLAITDTVYAHLYVLDHDADAARLASFVGERARA